MDRDRRSPAVVISALLLSIVALAGGSRTSSAAEKTWKAGAAKAVITPERPMWMSGYSSRDHVAEGKLHDLWAKALVLEDPAGKRVALVTLDLVGIDRKFSLAVRDALEMQYGLTRSQVALCSSHTHTGPVVGRNLRTDVFSRCGAGKARRRVH